MNVEKGLRKFLYNWVSDNFGVSEAENPSWSIEALAKDLAQEYWKISDRVELENIADDVKYVAENNGIELTDKQVKAVASKYRFSDAYCAMNAEDILYYIEHYKGEA